MPFTDYRGSMWVTSMTVTSETTAAPWLLSSLERKAGRRNRRGMPVRPSRHGLHDLPARFGLRVMHGLFELLPGRGYRFLSTCPDESCHCIAMGAQGCAPFAQVRSM